jgi:hypothetical protein
MIGRIVNVALVLAMVGGAVATYNLKHETEKAAARVARLHTGIAKEREAIAFLKAEWSMLSQPGRLQQLIARYQDHFRLEPFSTNQVATLDEIPLRPVNTESAAGEATVADAAATAAAIIETPR